MHVLITADTVGGVWTYTQELASGLLSKGHRVTLVSFGKLPNEYQKRWAEQFPCLDYRPTDFPLEWMEVAERDIEESKTYLQQVVREVHPDLLHFSQYCYGDLPADVPKVVVAHSDVMSWWASVHGSCPQDSAWMRRYCSIVRKGLAGADVVVAPSQWMLNAVCTYHHRPRHGKVIYNGRNPELFCASVRKQDMAVTIGRVWDEGKNIPLLLQEPLPFPLTIAGPSEHPERPLTKEDSGVSKRVKFYGEVQQPKIRELLCCASIYIAPSSYEPFGLAPLEAALSGCVLVMNDIPVFRELWGDAALFFRRNDVSDLVRVLTELQRHPELISEFGKCGYRIASQRFTANRMLDDYESLYYSLVMETQTV